VRGRYSQRLEAATRGRICCLFTSTVLPAAIVASVIEPEILLKVLGRKNLLFFGGRESGGCV